MSNHFIKTGRLTDAAIIAAFDELGHALGLTEITANVAGIDLDISSEDSRAALIKARSRTLSQVSARKSGVSFQVHYMRGTSVSASDLSRQPSAYFDEFIVSVGRREQGSSQPDAADVQSAIRIAEKHASGLSEAALENRAETATALLQEQFSQLAALQNSMLHDMEARRAALEAEHQERLAALEADEQRRLKDFQQAQAEAAENIAEQQAALSAKAKELDDRGHMHVRRLLREQITTDIQGRLQKAMLPPRTSLLRQGVLVVALLGALLLGALSYGSFTEYFADLRAVEESINGVDQAETVVTANKLKQELHTNAMWVALARGVAYSIGAVGFLLYAISWLKRIYYDDVRAMRELERYSIDLNRASWAIETIMEAKSQGDVSIPDLLVAGVSRHLFEHHGQKESEGTSDALAAVLRASAKAKIGPGGAEFELNNRGTTKLAKELEE